MEKAKTTFVDSHVHLDQIEEGDPRRLDWLKSKGCLLVSWSLSGVVDSIDELRNYLQFQADAIERFNENGLQCYFLTGVHPRNITQDMKASDIHELLTPHLQNPRCLGIGEIGLETARTREKVILAAQLALGSMLKSRGMKIGIHTPQHNKIAITEDILRLLHGYPGLEEITVIDHCTPKTAGYVLKSGYWAGVSLSPEKSSIPDLENIVKNYPDLLSKIMCNTDSGTNFYEDLFLLAKEGPFSRKKLQKLTRDNAFEFFNLKNNDI